ncbi:uncharacterized protein LOC136030217 [Artemia franciscana]|uniref:Uncharacterized protein n=1 Tax=Artemia franciscana TaxID=6661 RepID=A0AA88H788_ARTSF|nr:hypothetical protein QYM36_016576 [Artemia franciscana]
MMFASNICCLLMISVLETRSTAGQPVVNYIGQSSQENRLETQPRHRFTQYDRQYSNEGKLADPWYWQKRSVQLVNSKPLKDFKQWFKHILVQAQTNPKDEKVLKGFLHKLKNSHEGSDEIYGFEREMSDISDNLTGLTEKDSHLCHFKLCGVLQRRKMNFNGKSTAKRTRLGKMI